MAKVLAYYGEGQSAVEKVEDGTWEGITLGAWGDSVDFDSEIDVATLQRFAQTMFHRAMRAENSVQMFSDTAQNNVAARQKIATLLGQCAKEAAREQDWCDEYEKWTEKIRTVLTSHGFYSEAAHYGDAAERRERYTVTIEFLSRNDYAAQDFAYGLANNSEHTYGGKIIEAGDATRVVETVESDGDDDN